MISRDNEKPISSLFSLRIFMIALLGMNLFIEWTAYLNFMADDSFLRTVILVIPLFQWPINLVCGPLSPASNGFVGPQTQYAGRYL
ncbi:hypothetical protein ACQCVK_14620 [Rossellomorea vietnamensis]|uniref:hypothetical protein n=1 Tax=Rossellomorea vietnamensis TaxID=218284 RepID=UPI003CF6B356